MKTCRNCGKSFKQLVKINGRTHNLAKRVYCLDCSPFGRHNRKIFEKNHGIDPSAEKLCPACKQIKPIGEFYQRRDGKGANCYCVKCSRLEAKRRQWKFKQECVDYKGGKCVKCGYNKSIVAMDFHHRDPGEKDFAISSARFFRFDENVKRELDKCEILCANCHREAHMGIE